MRIFVTGVNGQLGFDCVYELIGRGHEVIGSDVAGEFAGEIPGGLSGEVQTKLLESSKEVQGKLSSESSREIPGNLSADNYPTSERVFSYVSLDITDPAATKKAITETRPDAIIHCASWTAVDAAEDEENKPKVRAVNVNGTRYLAEAAKAVDAAMLYISTDYVFGGLGTRPWQPDDTGFAPLNYYGQTKREGEQNVSSILDKFFVVRISWAFGRNGKNFIRTMINVGKTHDTVRVVDDQIGTPTYTLDLARLLADMIETDRYGFYHATNSESTPGGYISWADLAEETYRAAGMDVKVIRVSSEEYGLSKAARPKNSRLEKSKLNDSGFMPLPDWKDAVGRYVRELLE
ncbi:MAG: dTDP-4-dehydrorhamnose reductase [Lachnospiraceae bacterium]|nr:dTDP-4-dehydrorhamnose reductase [Lachnospiraceae bacterium]